MGKISQTNFGGIPTVSSVISRIIQLLQNFKFWFFLLIFYYLFSSSVYAVGSLVKHSHFETLGDLAVFNQGIWQYSKIKWPFITMHLNRPFLGDHFHPILITIVPFYWIFPNEKTLLFLQPFIVLSAIFPLFLIGLRITKSYFFSFCIIFAYSLYIPLQYAIFYDFHEIIFLPPLFAWAYYFSILNRQVFTSIFLILVLLTKEELGFFVAGFALYLILFKSKWRKFGLVWLIAGLGYSLLMMYFLIPAIGGNYLYFNYGSLGQTPAEVIINIFKNPIRSIQLFFDAPVKRETLYRTFYPFAFLPLLSPLGFLLSFEQIFTRFFDLRTITRWTIGYHYSVPMAIVAALGTILSVDYFSNFIKKYKKVFLIVLGILLIFLTRIEQINASAILLIKTPQFWQRDSWMDNIESAIRQIPPQSSVATQVNIISHLSQRERESIT